MKYLIRTNIDLLLAYFVDIMGKWWPMLDWPLWIIEYGNVQHGSQSFICSCAYWEMSNKLCYIMSGWVQDRRSRGEGERAVYSCSSFFLSSSSFFLLCVYYCNSTNRKPNSFLGLFFKIITYKFLFRLHFIDKILNEMGAKITITLLMETYLKLKNI